MTARKAQPKRAAGFIPAVPVHVSALRARGTAGVNPAARWSGGGLIAGLILALATCLCGCRSDSTTPAGNSNANVAEPVKPIVKTAERGPVKMTVTADKDRITIAEKLKLTIEVVAENGIDVDLGEPGDQLNEFQIRRFENSPEQTVEAARKWTRTYDLDIFLSGDYSIPAISARFVDRREGRADTDSEPKEGEIGTEPFTVAVTSLLEGSVDPTQFKDIKGPVTLPGLAGKRWVWWGAGGAAALAVAVAALVLWRRRRAKAEVRVVKPPHEWAFDQLRELIDAHLVEQGFVHEFYFRLSQIVRVYIELRFGLMAPERTTEEFLAEVRRGRVLESRHRTLLDDFLNSCDMVKFAKYQPTNTEIEDVFNAARDFIQETAPRQASQSMEVAA